jgi:hypothetical protein
VVVAARVSLYGGQEPAFSLPHFQGCWPQVCGCCRKESISMAERGAIDTGRVQWQLITNARHGSWERLCGGVAWAFGSRHAARPLAQQMYLGAHLDSTVSRPERGQAVSSIHRFDWAESCTEAHNLRTVVQAPVVHWQPAGESSAVDEVSRGRGQEFGERRVLRLWIIELRDGSTVNGAREHQLQARSSWQRAVRAERRGAGMAEGGAVLREHHHWRPALEVFQWDQQPSGARDISLAALGRVQRGMARLGVEFSERRWHFRVPPFVRENVFALEREANLGSQMVPRVQSDDWDSSMPLEQYRPRIVWWWLSMGQRVFSLIMGRHPAPGQIGRGAVLCSPVTVHNRHSGLVLWRREQHQAVRVADQPRRGRVLSPRRRILQDTRRWHVFCEEGSPLVLQDQQDTRATNFHPDFPVWGVEEEWMRRHTRTPPALWYIPPVECFGAERCEGVWALGVRCTHGPQEGHAPVELVLTEHAGGRRASRAQAAAVWRSENGVESTTWPRGVAASSGFRVPCHAGAAEARA